MDNFKNLRELKQENPTPKKWFAALYKEYKTTYDALGKSIQKNSKDWKDFDDPPKEIVKVQDRLNHISSLMYAELSKNNNFKMSGSRFDELLAGSMMNDQYGRRDKKNLKGLQKEYLPSLTELRKKPHFGYKMPTQSQLSRGCGRR